MSEAASFDAMLQCNLLEVFCEALGAAIFVTDKLDEISFASIRLLHLFPIRESAIAPGSRARDLYGALYDAGIRFGAGERPAGGREEWVAERTACAWKERVDKIEQTGPDRWMRIVSRRFSSGLGFVVIQDVSEQKKKETLLRNEQERVKLTEEVLDTLPVAVAVKDRNLNYVAVNQEFCRLMGATHDAILGHGSWDMLAPELAGHIEKLDWQLLSSGDASVSHITHTRADGRSFSLARRTRRLGRPGSHFVAVSLTEETAERDSGPADPHDALGIAHGASATPHPLRNVLFLTDRQGQALKLALRAHGADLCYIRDVIEFAAFLPASRAAGIAIDLVIIDHEFDTNAFNIAAANGMNFRMLPARADDSTAMAEILNAMPPAHRQVLEPPAMEPPSLPPQLSLEQVVVSEAPDVSALHVLAIEDNPVINMALDQMLGNMSLTFRIATSAATGLACVADHAPQVVLCDMTMPDMTAEELALGIRRLEPAARLVALIPADTQENHLAAQEAGFEHRLAKPFSAEALADTVARLLATPLGDAGASGRFAAKMVPA